MNPGDIFLIKDFDEVKYGPIKDTLFVYIGEIESETIIFISIKTTSQIQHYTPDGDRKNNPVIRYNQGQCGFQKETIIDLTDKIYELTTAHIDSCIKFGCIPDYDVARIYNLMHNNKSYMLKLLQDLYDDLLNHGISGLKKPKGR